jgi:hypothetical protein
MKSCSSANEAIYATDQQYMLQDNAFDVRNSYVILLHVASYERN